MGIIILILFLAAIFIISFYGAQFFSAAMQDINEFLWDLQHSHRTSRRYR